jgi:hypothetical protein
LCIRDIGSVVVRDNDLQAVEALIASKLIIGMAFNLENVGGTY